MEQTEHHVSRPRTPALLHPRIVQSNQQNRNGLNNARIWQVPEGMCVKLRLQVTRSAHQFSSVHVDMHARPRSAPSEKRSPPMQHHYALITACKHTFSLAKSACLSL